MQHKNILSTEQGRLSFQLLLAHSSGEFREVCSKWLCNDAWLQTFEPNEIRAIFHHQADGRPGQGLAAFRFEAQSYSGSIYALGHDNTSLLRKIYEALKVAPSPTPWGGEPTWEQLRVAATPQANAAQYWIPQMVVCKNAEQHHIWKAATELQRAEHVEGLVRRGIERQMVLLYGQASVVPKIEIKAISRERAVPRLRHSQANALVRVASVGFSAPLDLEGHWAAGGLINRGYGRILPKN